MKLTITIDLDNAAFNPECDTEATWILRELAHKLHCAILAVGAEYPLIDSNGNRVGSAVVTD